MKKKIAKQLRQRKHKILKRLDERKRPANAEPMLNPSNIHYEISDRNRGMLYGGMGAVQLLVKRLELDEYGDGGVGLELEGVVCTIAAGQRTMAQETQGSKGKSAAYGVQEVSQLFYHGAVSDCQDGPETCVSATGLE